MLLVAQLPSRYNPQVLRLPTWRMTMALGVVFYLCSAGWFFVLAPWSTFWGTMVVSRVPVSLVPWLDSPALRGALSGFGVFHFLMAFSSLSGYHVNRYHVHRY